MMRISGFASLSVGAMALCLAAGGCGGNGSRPAPVVTTPATPAPAPPPPTNFRTAEYQVNAALEQINVEPAYQRGGSGAGVLVSMIDSGIDVNNPEFDGRIDPGSADLVVAGVVSPGDVRPGGPSLQDIDGHGTSIAGILGAARNGLGMHGVAPQAQLLIYRADDKDDPETMLGAAILEGVNRSAAAGAKVMNLSLGSDEAGARDDFRHLFDIASGGDILVAVAAGNDMLADPEASALAATDPEARGAVIIVGAVNSANQIATFSNRAGVARDFYLAAPGVSIRTPSIGGAGAANELFSGTSAATPFVAGAAALIRQLWPQLTAPEVAEILFESATDLGAPGVDPIYGRGLVNVGAALQPLGAMTSASSSGVELSMDGPAFVMGPAFGAAAPEFGEFLFFDGYGREFETSLDSFVVASADFRVDPVSILRPFTRFDSHAEALGAGAMRVRVETENLTFTDVGAARRAPASFIGEDGVFERQSLAFAIAEPLWRDGSLAVGRGFSPREFDAMAFGGSPVRSIARDGRGDPYLSGYQSIVAAAVERKLGRALSVDFLMSANEGAALSSPASIFDPGALAGGVDQTNWRIGAAYLVSGGYVRLETGVLAERGGLLGSPMGGVFGDAVSGRTAYQAAAFDIAVGRGWRAHGRAGIGRSRLDAAGLDGFLIGAETVTSSHFALAAYREGVFAAADRLSFAVSQPLRVESGALQLAAPSQFDLAANAFEFKQRTIEFGAAPREIDVEAAYVIATGFGAVIEANLMHQLNATATGESGFTGVLRAGVDF